MAEPNKKTMSNFIDRLETDISKDVGNMYGDEMDVISKSFDKTLVDALKTFNSSTFDEEGFIKKMQGLSMGDKKDKDMIKNVLNNIKNEFIDVSSLNHSELLMRRDLFNICTQMPEMRDVVYVIRDAIIECNIASGEVSRQVHFENFPNNEEYEAQAKDIEKRHDLLMAIKNFIVPRTLMVGEMYIHVVPYSKLFAELEAVRDLKADQGLPNPIRNFRESIPVELMESFQKTESIYTDKNLELLLEAVTPSLQIDATDTYKIENNTKGSVNTVKEDHVDKIALKTLLENIHVSHGASVMMEENGVDAFHHLLMDEYQKKGSVGKKGVHLQEGVKDERQKHFLESMDKYFTETPIHRDSKAVLGKIPEEYINYTTYKHIKGCYVKYLDALRMVPIRIDRKVIGYYYISTSMDLQINPAQPHGIVDLSFQTYTRDKNLVDNLASLIIRSFDKKMLEKNIKLKTEIAEIIMAHRFSEGRLSFIYIPENEVIRLIINEDENGKGHSVLEPTLFPARMYLMLNLYNMVFSLNNTMTRIHYIRSSGLNKDYAAQIQRTMRKFQSRRITIDDIYSFHGVLNKVGGMGEMVMPAGRGDYKALETDTHEPVQNPISIEFLEQQRRQAISGTGVPHLLIINAIDEVDFAKTLEMANTRFLSTVSAYKIDMNKGITQFYQLLLKHSTDLEDDVVQSFRFQFNPAKQQDLNITVDMINNFNTLVEMVSLLYYSQEELQDKDGKPSPVLKHLKKALAREYIPQLNLDELDKIIDEVNLAVKDDELQQKITDANITSEEIEQVTD